MSNPRQYTFRDGRVTMADHAALDEIAALLDASDWDADTLSTVAWLVRQTGRVIRDTDGDDDTTGGTTP